MLPRVYAISDLHTDTASNMQWVQSLHNPEKHRSDILLVAGDVSEDLDVIKSTFAILTKIFGKVFFTAGNHDVWDPHDSLLKLECVHAALSQLGVGLEPELLHDKFWVCPLDSWHFFDDSLPHDLNLPRLTFWRDFEKCRWLPNVCGAASCAFSQDGESFNPAAKLAESRAVCQFMLRRNEEKLARISSQQAIRNLPVITFSHFVPRSDLNPRFIRFKELSAVSVCEGLDDQIRSIQSRIHLFGHTHHRTDTTIDGVRYVQFPLGYKGEGAYCPRYPNLDFHFELKIDTLL